MWNLDGYFMICLVSGYFVLSTESAGIFGTLLGDSDSNNNNINNNNRPSNPTIPLISSLGLGSNNRDETYRPATNEYPNNNGNRGLLPLLGVNTNNNRPNINNFNNNNRFTNTAQNANNINDLKKQVNEAEKLLEKLKEKNRLKEEQRLEEERRKQSEVVENNAPQNGNNKIELAKERADLKSLSKKKFFTIVKPVVPEDDAANFTETVYFFDY